MIDTFTPERRSEIMRNIRAANTQPEVRLRKALHALGFRYKLHVRDLPGTPDVVLPKYKAVIQIRGCFWHSHSCQRGRIPKSKSEYWKNKLERNRLRDASSDEKLRQLGWSVIVVWECEIRSKEGLEQKVSDLEKQLRQT